MHDVPLCAPPLGGAIHKGQAGLILDQALKLACTVKSFLSVVLFLSELKLCSKHVYLARCDNLCTLEGLEGKSSTAAFACVVGV